MEQLKALPYLAMASALLAAPLAATAADGPTGRVIAYATRTTLTVRNFDEDGTGFGVRGWVRFGVPFVTFEYQSTTVGDDPAEVDVDSLRLGGGAAFDAEPFVVFGRAELVDFGSDTDEDGFGIHGGAFFIPGPAMYVAGSLGYLSLNDTDGLELNVGAGFNFTKQWGASIDYRTYLGSIDNAGPGPDDFEVEDVRIGASFSFGG
jgi:hypothetical protein